MQDTRTLAVQPGATAERRGSPDPSRAGTDKGKHVMIHRARFSSRHRGRARDRDTRARHAALLSARGAPLCRLVPRRDMSNTSKSVQTLASASAQPPPRALVVARPPGAPRAAAGRHASYVSLPSLLCGARRMRRYRRRQRSERRRRTATGWGGHHAWRPPSKRADRGRAMHGAWETLHLDPELRGRRRWLVHGEQTMAGVRRYLPARVPCRTTGTVTGLSARSAARCEVHGRSRVQLSVYAFGQRRKEQVLNRKREAEGLPPPRRPT